MKILVLMVIVLVIASLFPTAFAQISVGGPAQHKLITIILSAQSDVHVIHEIKRPSSPVNVDIINGTISNLNVIDVEGNNVEFGITGIESTTGVTIFSAQDDVLVEYDLDDVLFFKDGIWTMDYFNFETTKILFPENINLLFVNDAPILLHDAKGITCYGKSHSTACDAFIEYMFDEPTKNFNVKWENENFVVGVTTLTDISVIIFDQSNKKISFDVNEGRQFITVIIPLELLWEPYEVYLNGEKILKHEFFSNETHSWLNFRPATAGAIDIIGTTVVPEFPILTPLVIGIAIVVALQLKNRFNLH